MAQSETNILLTADARNLTNSIRRADSEVGRFTTRSGRRLQRFGRTATASFRRVGSAVRGLGMGGLAGGIGLAKVAKDFLDLDARLVRVANVAKLSKREMFGLKQEIFDTSKKIAVGPGNLLSAIEGIVERTGDLDFARKSLKQMGIVGAATATEMREIGTSASDLQTAMGLTAKEILPAFDVLAVQGDQASFTLAKMSTQFARLFALASSFDQTKMKGLRSLGAFLQIAYSGIQSPERTTTATEAFFRDLVKSEKKLQKMGINVFDPESLKKGRKPVIRELDLLIKEIITKTQGSEVLLRKVGFADQALQALRPFGKKGAIEFFEKLKSEGGDGAEIMRKFSFWSDSAGGKIDNLVATLQVFANSKIETPVTLLTKALDILNDHPVWTNRGLNALIGYGGAKLLAAAIGGPAAIGLVGGVAASQIAKSHADARAKTGATGGLLGSNPLQMDFLKGYNEKLMNMINLNVNLQPGRAPIVETDNRNTTLKVTNTGSLVP